MSEPSNIVVLGLGLMLGLKHAADPDHIVAVTTFIGKGRHPGRACAIGLFWGLGHTIALLIAGLLVIGMKIPISKWIADRMELIVAVMLVRSFANLIAFDLGWDGANVVSLQVDPVIETADRRPWYARVEWSNRLIHQLHLTPGVASAAIVGRIARSTTGRSSTLGDNRETSILECASSIVSRRFCGPAGVLIHANTSESSRSTSTIGSNPAFTIASRRRVNAL